MLKQPTATVCAGCTMSLTNESMKQSSTSLRSLARRAAVHAGTASGEKEYDVHLDENLVNFDKHPCIIHSPSTTHSAEEWRDDGTATSTTDGARRAVATGKPYKRSACAVTTGSRPEWSYMDFPEHLLHEENWHVINVNRRCIPEWQPSRR